MCIHIVISRWDPMAGETPEKPGPALWRVARIFFCLITGEPRTFAPPQLVPSKGKAFLLSMFCMNGHLPLMQASGLSLKKDRVPSLARHSRFLPAPRGSALSSSPLTSQPPLFVSSSSGLRSCRTWISGEDGPAC